MDDIFIKVGESENESEPIELPVEKDNTIFLSSLCAQFPGACGIKYRNSQSHTMRGVKLVDGTLYLPVQVEDWKDYLYIVVYPKDNKRKMEDEDNTFRSKRIAQKCTDLIVLGLPWKVTEGDLKQYFSTFGELTVTLIKRDNSGKSKGYGFIRFGSYDAQLSALKKRHMIEGRWCDVKIPHSKEESTASPKIFVGRINETMTKDDIKSHFEEYGDVEDVYIPTPFRSFAFVTFTDPAVAQSLIGDDQVINGISVSINSANPRQSSRQNASTNLNSSNYQQNQPAGLRLLSDNNSYRQNNMLLPGSGNYTQQQPANDSRPASNINPSMIDPSLIAAAIGSWSHMMSGIMAGAESQHGNSTPQTSRPDGNNSHPWRSDSSANNWNIK